MIKGLLSENIIKGVLSENKIIGILSDESITDEIFWECFIQSENPLLHFDTRSGTRLQDKVSGEEASILVPCYLREGVSRINGSKTRDVEKVLDGSDYTLYFQFNQQAEFDPANIEDIMYFGGGTIAARRGIEIRSHLNDFWIYVADGTTWYTDELFEDCNTNLYGKGVFDCIIHVDHTNLQLRCSVYDSDGNQIGVTTNRDISALVFNSDDNYKPFTVDSYHCCIENIKKFEGIKTIEQCQTDNYVTDIQIHIPSVWSCVDISGNGNDWFMVGTAYDEKVYCEMNSWQLDYGFDWYYFPTDDYYQIACKDTDGNHTEPYCNSHLIWEADGGGLCRLRDAKIRFTNAFFDRSNTTIWNDTCRASAYYDATNTKDFHIEELNQKKIYDWLNAGYRGRLYVKMAPNSVVAGQGGDALLRDATDIINIILLKNDKTGENNKNVLTYTGDIIAAVLDDEGEITYDDDGYVALGTLKTTKGMFTIRIDDGYDNTYTDWWPFFDGWDIQPILNIHSQLLGQPVEDEFFDYMPLSEILELYADGWEIHSSGQYDNDWANSTYDETEDELSGSKSDIEGMGIECNHLIPNKRGIANRSARYLAKKYGFITCHAGYTYASTHGTNPQTIDKFNLCAMACDLFDEYFVMDEDNSEEIANIKAQLDVAKANNSWAILYFHRLENPKWFALRDEILPYAAALGLEHVNIDEALANTAYL